MQTISDQEVLGIITDLKESARDSKGDTDGGWSVEIPDAKLVELARLLASTGLDRRGIYRVLLSAVLMHSQQDDNRHGLCIVK